MIAGELGPDPRPGAGLREAPRRPVPGRLQAGPGLRAHRPQSRQPDPGRRARAPGAAHGARPRGDQPAAVRRAASRWPTPASTRSTGCTATTCRTTTRTRPAAAALLDEAGWARCRGGVRHNAAGEPLALELMTTAGNRTRELVEQVLQSQWRRLGIDVRDPQRAGAGVLRRDHRQAPVHRHGHVRLDQLARERAAHDAALGGDPDRGQRLGRARTTPATRTREMDQLIDAIEIELDRDKRARHVAPSCRRSIAETCRPCRSSSAPTPTSGRTGSTGSSPPATWRR